jgi:hypothetical protein
LGNFADFSQLLRVERRDRSFGHTHASNRKLLQWGFEEK